MYLNLSLKNESYINQRSCGLKATISWPKLPMKSTWQVLCLRVQSCTWWSSRDLKGANKSRVSRSLYSAITPTTANLLACTHTHIHNCEAWQGASDKYWPNPRNPKGANSVKPFLCMKRESFFLREKPSFHLPFPSFSFHW